MVWVFDRHYFGCFGFGYFYFKNVSNYLNYFSAIVTKICSPMSTSPTSLRSMTRSCTVCARSENKKMLLKISLDFAICFDSRTSYVSVKPSLWSFDVCLWRLGSASIFLFIKPKLTTVTGRNFGTGKVSTTQLWKRASGCHCLSVGILQPILLRNKFLDNVRKNVKGLSSS